MSVKIFICGFTGAGKSTFVGSLKNNDLGFLALDLDTVIAQDLSIEPDRLGDWILLNGFPLFRQKEKEKLGHLLDKKESLVVAMGGGALTNETYALIREKNVYLVFLDVDFRTCLSRVKDDPSRPLTFMPEDDLRKIYDERRMLFLKADLCIKELCDLSSLVHNLEKLKP
jgi:shikimate kinase